MPQLEISQENLNQLINTAEKKMHSEYVDEGEVFDPYDASGGNYDDAYELGNEDGDISRARIVLHMVGVNYTKVEG